MLGCLSGHQQQFTVLELNQVCRMKVPEAIRVDHLVFELVLVHEIAVDLSRQHVSLLVDDGHVLPKGFDLAFAGFPSIASTCRDAPSP